MRAVPALACLLPLAACASASDDYPSLERREVEIIRGTVNQPPQPRPDVPEPVAAVPAAHLAALERHRAQAQAAHQAFLASATRARSAVAAARGRGVASDAWASAQVALGALSSQRGDTAYPAAEIELLYVEAMNADYSADSASAAHEAMVALLAEQDAVLAELRAALRR